MLIVVPERELKDDAGICFHFGHLALKVNGDQGVVAAYDLAYRSPHYQCEGNDSIVWCLTNVISYIHNDVTIHDFDWHERIEREFDDPRVAIVGLGGAAGIGTREIYKRPYNIWQLQRINYFSNQTDWQVHGQLETGVRDVAVVDGFFMAVRRAFLDEIGGWSWMQTRFHCYDTALCLMARRKGWKVRMVGVHCTHSGGQTSTTPEYKQWLESQGTTQALDHSEPHKWLYEEFRDVLPFHA